MHKFLNIIFFKTDHCKQQSRNATITLLLCIILVPPSVYLKDRELIMCSHVCIRDKCFHCINNASFNDRQDLILFSKIACCIFRFVIWPQLMYHSERPLSINKTDFCQLAAAVSTLNMVIKPRSEAVSKEGMFFLEQDVLNFLCVSVCLFKSSNFGGFVLIKVLIMIKLF